jgi:hypothetical protein
VVERTLDWLTAHRRLARDCEHDPEVYESMIRSAFIDPDDPPPHPKKPSHLPKRWQWPKSPE